MAERMPDVLAGAMGNDMLTARFPEQEQALEFIDFYLKKV